MWDRRLFCRSWPGLGHLERQGIRTEEQIAEGAAQEVGDPPLRQVMRAIVDQVAALT